MLFVAERVTGCTCTLDLHSETSLGQLFNARGCHLGLGFVARVLTRVVFLSKDGWTLCTPAPVKEEVNQRRVQNPNAWSFFTDRFIVFLFRIEHLEVTLHGRIMYYFPLARETISELDFEPEDPYKQNATFELHRIQWTMHTKQRLTGSLLGVVRLEKPGVFFVTVNYCNAEIIVRQWKNSGCT